MKKPTLLYASPFWPEKSGISEYSEALVWGLEKYFEVTLIINNYDLVNKEIRDYFQIIKYNKTENYDMYDYIIYNFGNNPIYHSYMYDMILKYPGYVILHDFVLYYLTVGYYYDKDILFQKIYELEGINGIKIIKDSLRQNRNRDLLQHKNISSLLPLNSEIINNAEGIFVHSNYTKNLIYNINKELKVYELQLLKTLNLNNNNKNNSDYLYKLLNIKQNSYMIGAIGFIGPSKLNELTCLAVKEYNRTHEDKVYYVMVGDGDYVDHLLDEFIYKTGFIDNEKFLLAIQSCDIISNLRYPYNGEASCTLIQCMDIGKPCIVTDIGWFSEIPDEAVIKVPQIMKSTDLCHLIETLKNKNLNEMIRYAKEFVDNNCSVDKIAMDIYNSITKD